MSRVTWWFALVWTVGVTVYLAVAPIYGEKKVWMETTPSGAQVQHTEKGSLTLLDVNGQRVLAVLAIPLMLVVAPALARKPDWRRKVGVACALLLFVLSFIASASIGLFYYPSWIALLLAATSMRTSSQLIG